MDRLFGEGMQKVENQYSQLRFDISEKVSLHPQQLGIARLLELDLFPDVQILDEGHHVKIQGYLRLNGSYVGESNESEVTSFAEEPEEISYVIPVEITLPSDRADMGNVSAEVESFDYQVISPYELQIEAILSIDGISSEDQHQQQHLSHEEPSQIEDQPFFQAEPVRSVEREIEPQETPNYSVQELFTQQRPETEGQHQQQFTEDHQPEKERFDNNDYHHPVKSHDEPEEEVVHPFPVEAKQPELDRDFSSNEQELVGRRGSSDQEAREFELDEPAKGVNEWSYWLVGKKPETFTAMRLVIVQKEESIESLADRYQVSSSRLKHYNHLNSEQLEEGQIVCIPSTD